MEMKEWSQWEPFYDPHIGSGRLAVDVGANCGQHTTKMAKTYAQVIAFEPQDEIRRILRARTPSNVEVRHEVVYCRREVIKFFVHPAHQLSGLSRINPMQSHSRGRVVPKDAIALDDLGLKCVDLIKIDTEGSELDVLAGAEKTIREWRPRLLIELHRKGEEEAVRQRIIPLAYKFVEIPLKHFDVRWMIGYPLGRKEA